MSQELIKARSLLSQVNSLQKQGKFLPALQSLQDGLLIVMRNPLLKQEKEEFERILEDIAFRLDANKKFRELVPLKITYAPGQEKKFYTLVKNLLRDIKESAVNKAKQRMEEMQKLRAEGLRKGIALVQSGKFDEAREHFAALVRQIPDDTELKAEIGEIYLRAAQYKDAYEYLAAALRDSPESIHLYNRIGIALRKMGEFETAERYYQKALEYTKGDYNLYFNFGRLYLDWKKWGMVAKMAEKALKHNPEFEEARKMLNFATKKLNS